MLTRGDRSIIAEGIRRLAMERAGGPNDRDGRRRSKLFQEADRLAECGELNTVLRCPNDGHQFKIACGCHSRACPSCGAAYSKRLRRRLREVFAGYYKKMPEGWSVKFLTLTVERDRFGGRFPNQSDIDLASTQAANLIRWFFGRYQMKISRNGRFNPTKIFRGAGAVLTLEFSPSGFLHFHAVCYGPYVPQREISKKWHEITGDSFVCSISRPGGGVKHVVNYVLKYASKPPDFPDYDLYAEYVYAVKGVRRLRTYGAIYNQVVLDKHKPLQMVCIYCGAALDWRGVHKDPHDHLIEFVHWQKYVDPAHGVFVRDYSGCAGLPFSKDKAFNPYAEEVLNE